MCSILCSVYNALNKSSPVEAGHGVHHQPEVPHVTTPLEERNQLVLVHVLRDLPAEYLHKNWVNIFVELLRI